MNMHLIFAANDEIVGLIFTILGVIAWIINHLSGKNQAAPPPARPRQPARPRDDRLKDEIDIFIKEVRGQVKEPQPRIQPSQSPPSEGRPPLVARGDQTGSQSGKRRKQPRPADIPLETASRSKRRGVGDEIANRAAPGHRNLGNAIRADVAQDLPPRISDEVREDMKDRVDISVSDHLGKFTGADPAFAATPSRAFSGSQVGAIFHDRSKVQQAILINEILSKPLALRNRK